MKLHARLALPLLVLALASTTSCKSTSIAHIAAGELLVLNKSDASLSVIDPRTGKHLTEFAVGVGPHEVAVSADGRTCVVANYGGQQPGNTLTVIDLGRREIRRTIDLARYSRPHGIWYVDDERVLVTSEDTASLIVVNVESGEVERAMETKQQASHMVVPSVDKQRAYVANIASGSISVLALADGKLLAVVPTGAGAEGLDAHPNGREVWVANRSADTISIVDTSTLEVVADIDVSPDGAGPQETQGGGRPRSFPIRLKFTRDGQHALVSNAIAGDVAVIDCATQAIVKRIPMQLTAVEAQDGRLFDTTEGPTPVGILMAPRGRYAFVANTNADIVTVIDLHTWEIAGRLATDREPDGLGFTEAFGKQDSGLKLGFGVGGRVRIGG